jgi:hypothetical protein
MTFVKESRHALVHSGDLDCRLDVWAIVLEAHVRLLLLLNTAAGASSARDGFDGG